MDITLVFTVALAATFIVVLVVLVMIIIYQRYMGVFVVKNVAGREAKSQIGKLKILALEGDDISRCKVQSGGKDIKAALDAQQRLLIISTD